MIRLLVTGGRDYDDAAVVDRVLSFYLKKAGAKTMLLVIHGGARGLDALAGDWCDVHGVPCVCMPAAWKNMPRAAGIVRNAWMLKYLQPTHCYVFPGGRGTLDMRTRALAAGLRVRPRQR